MKKKIAVKKVLSNIENWKQFNQKFNHEINELLDSTSSHIDQMDLNPKYSFDFWTIIMVKKRWGLVKLSTKSLIKNDNYCTKNGICASVSYDLSYFMDWMLDQNLLVKYNKLVKTPILLIPTQEFIEKRINNSYHIHSFEKHLENITRFNQINISTPFFIIGYDTYTENNSDVEEIDFMQLMATPNNKDVYRFIEFPSQYYQAGLNILSFFNTYIKKQYPEEEVKIKIEQEDNIVKLIIETEDGKRDVVEKALQEYELVITGQKTPEEVTQNQELILELRNELRFAKVRIESQQDIIQLQQGQIDNFFNIIGAGLSKSSSVNIDFNPNISLTNSVNINHDISLSLGSLNEVKELLPSSSPIQKELNDLETSLESIEKETNPEIVKKSPAMNKFRRFLEKVKDGNKDLKKVIDTTETGVEVLRDLAGKYNKIAEWCGLPQVPSVFTK